MDSTVKVIAFYLPQFHPIPENDTWWGKGFTEWTNVAKAKPLYKGHYQPKIPADLGFYDLRVPESRIAQADMAREYGISAFCYWHYWFGHGKRLLERPINEVLKSGKPDFPFCLGWANSSWRGFDYGCNNERNLLIEQKYPGIEDYEAHFHEVLCAFQDDRYFRIDGNPVFLVFQPYDLPDPHSFIDIWKRLAVENGLKGIHFVAQTDKPDKIGELRDMGFDSVNLNRLFDAYNKGVGRIRRSIIRRFQLIKKIGYAKAVKHFLGAEDETVRCYPSVYPNWDHTARSGKNGLVLHGSTPEIFEEYFRKAVRLTLRKPISDRVIFIKSWNEWAEGNYLEPDTKYGLRYLESVKKVLEEEALLRSGRV